MQRVLVSQEGGGGYLLVGLPRWKKPRRLLWIAHPGSFIGIKG
jgi:hypothetical protein